MKPGGSQTSSTVSCLPQSFSSSPYLRIWFLCYPTNDACVTWMVPSRQVLQPLNVKLYLYYITNSRESLISHQSLSNSRIFQHFMEAKTSLLLSWETCTGPYPRPDQSTAYHPRPKSPRPVLILSSHVLLGVLVVSFLLADPPKPCTNPSSLCVLYALPISSFLTIVLGEVYKLWSSLLFSFQQPPINSFIF
jgi:hypothetical protein